MSRAIGVQFPIEAGIFLFYECLGFDEKIITMSELAAFLKRTDSYENVNSENSGQWVEVDCMILGCEALSDKARQLK
jgi:hypothetical protein